MDVREQAADGGYQLDEKPLNGRWVWAWHRVPLSVDQRAHHDC